MERARSLALINLAELNPPDPSSKPTRTEGTMKDSQSRNEDPDKWWQNKNIDQAK